MLLTDTRKEVDIRVVKVSVSSVLCCGPDVLCCDVPQDVPVLLTRGEFDEVSAASAGQVAAALPSSGRQVATFKASGSYMHIGECQLQGQHKGRPGSAVY